MSQKSKTYSSPEVWANHVGADLMMKGMANFFHGLWKLFIKLMASISLVFLRAKTGSKFITLSTLFWGWGVLSFYAFMEGLTRIDIKMVTGEAPTSSSSVGLVGLHLMLFLFVGAYRFYEARYNLRRNNGKQRFSGESGYSILWPLFARLLAPFGLIARDPLPDHWWQLTEYRFQKIIEPALIMFAGIFLITLGYGVYGGLLLVSGFSCFALFMSQEDVFFDQKQEKWDANLLNGFVTEIDKPIKRERGMIIQQTLMRTRGFEEWQGQRDNEPYFETAEPVSGQGVRAGAAR